MILRMIDMFAGIGGFSLGLHRAGLAETVAVAELDPYASKVLALRFPGAPNVGDVTTAEYPDADIICAGFPCQDISFAGAGAGLAGKRSGLWREVVRAIRVVRPRFALLENVAALLSRGLDTVLGDLAEVGHDAEWHCIPAAAVGAPHRRDRIWIIAHPRGEQHEGNRAPFSGEIATELSRAVADTESDGQPQRRAGHQGRNPAAAGHLRLWDELSGDGSGDRATDMADADSAGLEGRPQTGDAGGGRSRAEQFAERRADGHGGQWAVEPNVGRVAHGVPARVDRLRCLGNAVVPQVVELIGRAILASMVEQRAAA